MTVFPKITLLYDGECAFCIRWLTLLRKFDSLARIEMVDSGNRVLVSERFPALPALDFDTAMHAVDSRGNVHSGFDAFRAALWSSPILALFAWTWYLPGVRGVGLRVYAWVAKNRRQFGCSVAP